MIPILSAEQIRRVEQRSMEREPILAIDLMERAAAACVERILAWTERDLAHTPKGFTILAGMGNNGGDGLVIARLLKEAGLQVRVLRVLQRPEPGPDYRTVHDRAVQAGVNLIDIDHSTYDIELSDDQIVIDCIFGTGLTRAPVGWVAQVIAAINASPCKVVSIDLPSGAVAPESGVGLDPLACIKADLTLTFEVPRMALLMPETGPCAGNWELVPIGLDRQAMEAEERLGSWVELADIQTRLHTPARFGYKGTFGHARIIAGSAGLYGAAVLAVQGALRSGVGLVSAHIPSDLAIPLSIAYPDCMTIADGSTTLISTFLGTEKASGVGIGPGIGTGLATAEVVKHLWTAYPGPLLLDADALNILAATPGGFAQRHGPLVLTPHPAEMDRLLGHAPRTAYERLLLTKTYAQEWNCIVVLKGAYTAICTPDGSTFMNSTGNVGMAKGGSGDVLTGLLTGLLAQGYAPLDACLIGVFLHGLAGDLAAERLSMQAMRPSDLVDALPKAWLSIGGTTR